MRQSRLIALGGTVGHSRVTNTQLEETLETTDDWIVDHVGVRTRYFATYQSTAELATEAARRAIATLEHPSPIDAVIVATSTPDHACPATAPSVAAALDFRGIPAFDVNAACSGFLYGLHLGDALIKSAICDTVLLIGADRYSQLTDPGDRTTRPIFGDGASAAILTVASASTEIGGELLRGNWFSDGSHADILQTDEPSTPPLLRMQGKPTYAKAVRGMSHASQEILDTLQWSPEQTIFVGHQANANILTAVARRLGVPFANTVVNIGEVGNTTAASIPLAMQSAYIEQKIYGGEHLLLSSFGAGLTWGAFALNAPHIHPTPYLP